MILKSTNLKSNLPHQGDKIYIADGGLETTFVFLKDIDLPILQHSHSRISGCASIKS